MHQSLSTQTMRAIQERACLYRMIRAFFEARAVLEVETPILSSASVSDPAIQPLITQAMGQMRYLHSSPEYPMKRLLCAGVGSIYQICKVFRDQELGRRHQPEFSMLEWYRVGFDHQQLMDEVAALVGPYLGINTQQRLSYQSLFKQYVDLDPLTVNDSRLSTAIHRHGLECPVLDRQGMLDVLMTHTIEPQLPTDSLVFVEDFPAEQAALAKVQPNETGVPVAKRFELYVNGLELANGYWELTDAKEQERRFVAHQAMAHPSPQAHIPHPAQNLAATTRTIDQNLLQAMAQGMPECAGVALGLDRLLMLKLGTNQITGVVSFGFDQA